MAYPDHMPLVERPIVDRIIRKALKKGYFISVYDGEEWALKISADYEAITAEVAATDMTQLKIRDPEKQNLGSILLIHGNHEDVVSDCTDVPAILELVD